MVLGMAHGDISAGNGRLEANGEQHSNVGLDRLTPQASGSDMMLRFTTDGSVTRSGFSATFSCATTMGTSCGADMVVNLNERGPEGNERFSTTGKNNDFTRPAAVDPAKSSSGTT